MTNATGASATTLKTVTTTDDGVCHVETETQTIIAGLNSSGESLQNNHQHNQTTPHPIKRKLSLALKFARRALQRHSSKRTSTRKS